MRLSTITLSLQQRLTWVRLSRSMANRFQGRAIATLRITLASLTVVLLVLATDVEAAHESTNTLTFAPVAGSSAPNGSGVGTVEFGGGEEPTSRWTATFHFAGLQADADYTIVVQGRYGEDGSPEASEFSPICAFRTDNQGAGGCWHYFLGLAHLNVVQARFGDMDGSPVLQATRANLAEGPGSIVSTPNRHSPPSEATPVVQPSPATPESPVIG